MPARIVVVHDDQEFAAILSIALGADVAWFADPMKGHAALEAAEKIGFLVTLLQFDNDQPIGLPLARLARAARPEVRVIFTESQRHREFTRGLG